MLNLAPAFTPNINGGLVASVVSWIAHLRMLPLGILSRANRPLVVSVNPVTTLKSINTTFSGNVIKSGLAAPAPAPTSNVAKAFYRNIHFRLYSYDIAKVHIFYVGFSAAYTLEYKSAVLFSCCHI